MTKIYCKSLISFFLIYFHWNCVSVSVYFQYTFSQYHYNTFIISIQYQISINLISIQHQINTKLISLPKYKFSYYHYNTLKISFQSLINFFLSLFYSLFVSQKFRFIPFLFQTVSASIHFLQLTNC